MNERQKPQAEAQGGRLLPEAPLFGDLIRLAAEMARCEGMPSPFVEDWKLPKTTPVKTLRLINETSCKAEDQCKRWAHRLRVLADTLRSPNVKVSDPAHKTP